MPELPEVETIARHLRPALIGQRILGVELLWPRTLAHPSAEEFYRRLPGQSILEVTRRAKYLILRLERDYLFIHLRMSGDLQWHPAEAAALPHDRLHLLLAENSPRLAFHDPRKFGRVWLLADPTPILSRLGPEPLADDFTPELLYRRLQSTRRRIKPLLLDQSFLAGLGNIYSDEALHYASIHPLRASQSITLEEAWRLWQAIRDVLQEGIRRNGASIDWVYRGGEFQNHFRVYARSGETCYHCGTPIQRLRLAQRSTYFCPTCQK